MSEKRFWINKSRLVNDGWVIDDLKREFTFPVVVGDKTALYSYCKALNKLFNENEQLKQRNINQYNQLNQLWQLIEAKDWETLTEMNNQIKEDEERLQKEDGIYNGSKRFY